MDDIFAKDKTFADLGLGPDLVKAIDALGFKHPTHVQAQVMPVAIAGRDVLAQSKTGTGKTAAFGLPILERLDGKTPFAALILCPVRELAVQVAHEMRNFARYTDLKIVPVYGGQRMSVQIP